VPNWTLARLKPNDWLQVKDAMLQQIEDEDIEFGTRGKWIIDDLQVGKKRINSFRWLWWSILDYVGYQMCTCVSGKLVRWMEQPIPNMRCHHLWILVWKASIKE